MSDVPRSLDELGVPQEYRDRAKMLWLITCLGALWGWVICNYVWKIEGQENNAWYQDQLKQALYVGLVGWLGAALCGIGYCVSFVVGLMGFLAMGKNQDFLAPMVGGMARK